VRDFDLEQRCPKRPIGLFTTPSHGEPAPRSGSGRGPVRGPGRSRSARLPILRRAQALWSHSDRSAIRMSPKGPQLPVFRGNSFRPPPRKGPCPSGLPAPNHPSAELPGCPESPGPLRNAVSRAPVRLADSGHPDPANPAWACGCLPRGQPRDRPASRTPGGAPSAECCLGGPRASESSRILRQRPEDPRFRCLPLPP
jgi:hypothetical protein